MIERPKGMTKISVIIATANEPVSLWHTINSFTVQLGSLGYSAEIIISDNLPGKNNITIQRLKDYGYKVIDVEGLSTSVVRNEGAKASQGELLCFSDTHVVPCEKFLRRTIDLFESNPDMDILHNYTRFWGKKDGYYSYSLTLAMDFNGFNNSMAATYEKPHPIAASGHGLYTIRRSTFDKIGGYLPTQKSWGGEELYLDLLTWMYGGTVILDPTLYHFHLPGEYRDRARPYEKNGYEWMKANFAAAYVLGGKEWIDKIYPHFAQMDEEVVDAVIPVIIKENEIYRRKVQKEAMYTLEQIFQMFDDNGIPYTKEQMKSHHAY